MIDMGVTRGEPLPSVGGGERRKSGFNEGSRRTRNQHLTGSLSANRVGLML